MNVGSDVLKNIHVSCLNVCGLKSKLLCPEFCNLIKTNDILIFVETKTDSYDDIEGNLPNGYLCFSKYRSKFVKKSGGIVIVYREGLKDFLKFHITNCDFVQWVEIQSEILSTDKNLLLGGIYIPPENTKYASNEAFTDIENEMLVLNSKTDCNVCLVGDFNAKTKLLNDVVIPEDSLFEILDEIVDDDDLLSYVYDYQVLVQNNIPLQRYSTDQSAPNNFGYKLIEFCKRNNLYIGNGRLPGNDYQVGIKTCKNVSLIDYVLLSSHCFELFSFFNVNDFDPLFSDVHNCITFCLNASVRTVTINPTPPPYNSPTHVPRWVSYKENRFIESINNDVTCLTELQTKLEEIRSQGQGEVSVDSLNEVVRQIAALFKKSALSSFGKPKRRSTEKENHKVWFDKKCAESRAKFHKARNRYSFIKNRENREALKNASKQYKSQMNTSYKNYQHRFEQDLRLTSKKDSKKLWKILNRVRKGGTNAHNKITIEQLYEYFKSLNKNDDDTEFDPDADSFNVDEDVIAILDCPITEDEIKLAIKSLKNGKASGDDEIVNEFIKSSIANMLPIYVKLFNIVLDTGLIPDTWLSGIIKPIYKNKGDRDDLDNYRAICLTSNLGKVFTSVINTRLNKMSDEFRLISDSQGGFRKGYSAQDNIFILHSLISLYLSSGKKLYCAFIDFRKAFDTVWRVGLFQKLLKNNISGKVFNVILNMYTNIKSCVKMGELKTEYFPCEIGVRQGEKLSPFLFALYLNDLEEFFTENSISSLQYLDTKSLENIGFYIKLFILLYADDTVIFADTPEELQTALDVFEQYCATWKLTVNVSKTKIIIFSKRKSTRRVHFNIFEQNIEICDSYTYLGLIFNYNGNFYKSRNKLVEQAQKALYALYYKVNNISIPIDLQLKLFDSLVAPILTYSSEIWGFENKSNIEKIQLQFCKKILNLRSSTPNFMVYGELGRYPIEISIKLKMICFWFKLVNNTDKLSGKLYNLMFNMYENGDRSFKWICYIKSIFDDIGCSEIWNIQGNVNINFLKLLVKQILQDQFIQKWYSDIDASSRGNFYSKFKIEFRLEPYLLRLKKYHRTVICKLRTCNIKFPMETGRWYGTPQHERVCTLCRTGLGDEFHYVALCNHDLVTELRNKYIPGYYTANPNVNKLYGMIMYCNTNVLTNLSIFIAKVAKLL